MEVDDIRHGIEAKRAVVEREGLLEYYPLEESTARVADLGRLREWLKKRKAVVAEPLRAKAVAMEWKLPLLKLDTSTLYNKFIGESEKNFKRAMRTANNIDSATGRVPPQGEVRRDLLRRPARRADSRGDLPHPPRAPRS